MKAISIILVPSIALLVSACASGPAGAVYGSGYGPGPTPRSGYYWNGTIYVEGQNPYDQNNQYNRSVNTVDVNRTNVNDVDVNRTTVNDRNVNNTNVNNTRENNTTVNNSTLSRAKVQDKNKSIALVAHKKVEPKAEQRPTPNS